MKMHKGFAAVPIIAIVGAIVVFSLVLFFALQKPKAEVNKNTFANVNATVKENSSAVTELPTHGNATSVILDFAGCSPGGAVVYFGFGSTHFSFEGIRNGSCDFVFGTEIENPNWDGLLDTTCTVPISSGQKEFPIVADGIVFGNFLEPYCKNTKGND